MLSNRFRSILLISPPVGLAAFCVYLALSPATDLWAQAVPQVEAQRPRGALPTRLPPPGTFEVATTGAPRLPRPVPVQSLVTFETAFIQRLNEAIRNPEALKEGKPKVVVIVDTKVWREIVDTRAIVVVESARTVELTTAQMQELRDTLLRQVDNAVRAELAGRGGLRQLGSGIVLDDVIVANLKPVAN
ncbi:MAG TPA: hypothetical protein VNJ11_03135 [Bryobacteraceae bacterium]|nr:hypothetical protein [Bryobacteraceae bacterium]